MPYAEEFRYDLFISYAAVDDSEFVTGRDHGWVSLLVRQLESVLASRLGGREVLRIYFDRRDLGGNHQLVELLDAVKASALFLAVTSSAYVAREWTRKELAAFVASSSATGRLFAIEHLPLDDGEEYPPPLNEQSRTRFWERSEAFSQTAIPMMPGNEAFIRRVHDLADRIKKQIVSIKKAEDARPALRQVASVIARDAAVRHKGVIYLAQTTDDLEEERLQLQRYLEQVGFLTLPSQDLPGGGAAFGDAVEAQIRQADLYVHLLGPRSGRYPKDLPDGYGLTQFRIAVAQHKSRLLWRHPELNLEQVTDERQKAFLSNEDVMACGLQQFKDAVRQRLEARSKTLPAKSRRPALVFLNSTQDDETAVQIALQELAVRDIPAVRPLYEGPAAEVQSDILANMQECDVMVLIYGEAPQAWVRSQLRLFSKVKADSVARSVAVFVGPPAEKPAELGITFNGLRRVDFPEGWSAEWIRRALEEVGT
jgi:hypothetical protein